MSNKILTVLPTKINNLLKKGKFIAKICRLPGSVHTTYIWSARHSSHISCQRLSMSEVMRHHLLLIDWYISKNLCGWDNWLWYTLHTYMYIPSLSGFTVEKKLVVFQLYWLKLLKQTNSWQLMSTTCPKHHTRWTRDKWTSLPRWPSLALNWFIKICYYNTTVALFSIHTRCHTWTSACSYESFAVNASHHISPTSLPVF